jgi:hypothetical protein
MLKPSMLPIVAEKDRRNIDPERTQQKFAKAFLKEGLTKSLLDLLGDTNYKDWKDVRNILSHRVSPQLTQYIGGDQPILPKWETKSGVVLDQGLTTSKRSWLAATLRDLLQAADSFTRHRFLR